MSNFELYLKVLGCLNSICNLTKIFHLFQQEYKASKNSFKMKFRPYQSKGFTSFQMKIKSNFHKNKNCIKFNGSAEK